MDRAGAGAGAGAVGGFMNPSALLMLLSLVSKLIGHSVGSRPNFRPAGCCHRFRSSQSDTSQRRQRADELAERQATANKATVGCCKKHCLFALSPPLPLLSSLCARDAGQAGSYLPARGEQATASARRARGRRNTTPPAASADSTGAAPHNDKHSTRAARKHIRSDSIACRGGSRLTVPTTFRSIGTDSDGGRHLSE